jgi:hypothetical protein
MGVQRDPIDDDTTARRALELGTGTLASHFVERAFGDAEAFGGFTSSQASARYGSIRHEPGPPGNLRHRGATRFAPPLEKGQN